MRLIKFTFVLGHPYECGSRCLGRERLRRRTSCQCTVASETLHTNLRVTPLADAATRWMSQKLLEALETSVAHLCVPLAAHAAGRKVQQMRLVAHKASCSDLGIAYPAHTTAGMVQIGDTRKAAPPELAVASVANRASRPSQCVDLEACEASRTNLGITSLTHTATAMQQLHGACDAPASKLGVALMAHSTSRKVEQVGFETRQATRPNLSVALAANPTPIKVNISSASDATRSHLLVASVADAADRRIAKELYE